MCFWKVNTLEAGKDYSGARPQAKPRSDHEREAVLDGNERRSLTKANVCLAAVNKTWSLGAEGSIETRRGEKSRRCLG